LQHSKNNALKEASFESGSLLAILYFGKVETVGEEGGGDNSQVDKHTYTLFKQGTNIN